MPTYCKPEDTQATIDYSFKSVSNRLIIKNVPIEVEKGVKGYFIPPEQQERGQLYKVNMTLNRPNYAGISTGDYYFYAPITGTEVVFVPNPEGNNYQQIYSIYASGSNISGYTGRLEKYFVSNSFNSQQLGSLTINSMTPVNPGPEYKEKCFIKISYRGNTLFYKEGDCPCEYDVTCGQECPPGTVKCSSTDYPGYCCLPCEPTKQAIRAIALCCRTTK